LVRVKKENRRNRRMKLRNDFNNRLKRRKLNFQTRGKKKWRVRRLHTIFIATPAERPVLIGQRQRSPTRGRGKRFFKNNFNPDYGFAFSQTSLHSVGTV
jgi:hypothetical protein